MSTEQIRTVSLQLPPAQRAALAEQLLASLDGADQATLDAAWAVEAERRIDAYDAGKLGGTPANEVFRAITGRR